MVVKMTLFLSLLVICLSRDVSSKNYGGSGQLSSGTTTSTPATSTPGSESGSGFPTSNKGCFPNIVPTVPSDSRNKVGIFYEARSKSVSKQAYNAMFNNSLEGKNPLVWMPATTTLAIHLSQNYQHVMMDANGNPACDRQDIDFLSRLDGVCFLQESDIPLNGAADPLNLVQYYLYTDESPKGWEIVYICNQLNAQSGMCDDPNIYVNTRVHPNQMSAADKSAMDAAIDQTLKPYCMSKADLQTTIFRTDIPACNAAAAASYTSLIAGWDASLAHPSQ